MCIKSLSGKFIKLDIYGRELKFEEEDFQSHKTLLGASLTVLTLLLVIGLGFIIGKDMLGNTYNQTNSIVVEPVSLTSLPLVFYFTRLDGSSITNINTLVNITVSQVDSDKENLEYNNDELRLDKCRFMDASISTKIIIKELEVQGLEPYCMYPSKYNISNKSLLLLNPSYVRLVINQYRELAPFEDKNTLMSDIKVAVYHKNSLVETDKALPIHYEKVITRKLSPNISSKIDFSFTRYEVSLDKGWILEYLENTRYYNLGILNESTLVSNHELLELNFFLSIVGKKVLIKSLKIQVFLANIGGLLNFMYVLFSCIVHYYSKFRFKLTTFPWF